MNLPDKPEVAQAGAQLLHPGSRILFRHWESVRAERPCPDRADMDLRAISKLMPWLAIVEMGHEARAPLFKLAGTGVCELFQRQLTGAEVGQAMERFERRVVEETLQLSLQRLQPSLVRLRFLSVAGNATIAEFLALPVINSSLAAPQLFCGMFPFANQPHGQDGTLNRIELVATRMIWTEHLTGELLLNPLSAKTTPVFKVIEGGLSSR
jgi:hypothetical protein